MPYDMLKKLLVEGRLGDCSIAVAHANSVNKIKTIQGSLVISIKRSGIEYLGGETGHERFLIPLDLVLGIKSGSRMIYRKKNRVERIFPRA